MKDRVGCVRASTYSLPAEGHSYGMKTEQADEGVGTSKLIIHSSKYLRKDAYG